MWPDRAIYQTLGNFSNPLATFFGQFFERCPNVSFFYGNHFCVCFIDTWQLFTGHTVGEYNCVWVITNERERERVKQIESQLWDFYICICCKILSEEKSCLCQIRKTRDKREKTFLKTGHNLFLQNSQSVSPSISRWVRTTTKNYFTFLLTVIGVLK